MMLNRRAGSMLFFLLAATAARSTAAQVAEEAWFPGSSSIVEPEVIPPAYRGRWAPSRAACLDQDGVERREILPDGVDHYESGGWLDRVTQTGQERSIRVKLSYEGEGEFWDRIETWTLSESGDRLTIEEGADTTPYTIIRCD